MSRSELNALIRSLGDLIAVLAAAAPADKADLYARLGLRLTYNPGKRTVLAEVRLATSCTKDSCRRGDLN